MKNCCSKSAVLTPGKLIWEESGAASTASPLSGPAIKQHLCAGC